LLGNGYTSNKRKLLGVVFSVWFDRRLYNEDQCGGLNISTVALRVLGDKKGTSAWGYNWVTLFLGDIYTGTWPSRLGES
jgi:hypothetical protein